MTDHRPGHHNSVKNQARAHQRRHPGTTYTAALAAVTSAARASAPRGWEPLVGAKTIEQLDALVGSYRRDAQTGASPALRAIFSGPPGTGKSTAAALLADKLGLASPTVFTNPGREGTGNEWPTVGGTLVLESAAEMFASPWPIVTEKLAKLASHNDRLAIIWMQYHDRDWRQAIAGNNYEGTAEKQAWVQRYLDQNFTHRVSFPGLSAGQIVEIAAVSASAQGNVLTPEAARVLTARTAELADATTSFGGPVLDRLANGHFAHTVIDYAADYRDDRVRRHHRRLHTVSRPTLTEITVEDIVAGIDRAVAQLS